MARRNGSSEYFDAGYGIVSVGLTTTGVVIVATTGGAPAPLTVYWISLGS